jgi:1,4-dihydroxy-2-naphthoate polyprenyltransferase
MEVAEMIFNEIIHYTLEEIQMQLKSFFELVEIRTKIASIIPCLLGTVYALYHFDRFNIVNFIIFFAALIIIDMFTTALNNYFDYKRAVKKHGYNYEIHNIIVREHLSEFKVLTVIFILLGIAVILGILLTLHTSLIVLIIGAASFLVGICYSFGPIPISRTFLGETFSGFFMGFVIVFLAVYIHIYDSNIISIAIQNFDLVFHMNLKETFSILLLSVPTLCGIANIMLANNICDIEDDIKNNRYTLPVFIGKKKALFLFKSIYCIAYADIIVLAALRLIPVICLLALLTFIPVYKNIKLFDRLQAKSTTFSLAVKNFALMCVPFVGLFFLVWGVENLLPI